MIGACGSKDLQYSHGAWPSNARISSCGAGANTSESWSHVCLRTGASTGSGPPAALGVAWILLHTHKQQCFIQD